MSTSRSKSQSKQQNAGAWFQGPVSPLMIDVPISPHMFQSFQKGGSGHLRVQERVPLPSRQVNETYAPFKLQQGGAMSQKLKAALVQKARRTQYGGQGLTEKARKDAGMQANRKDNLPIASRTRSKTASQQGGGMSQAYKATLAQKASKDAQYSRLAREFAARRGAAMQAERLVNLPPASSTRASKKK